ncbi:hypothetical protein B0H11DRAFT_732280 [Mycena galericulata]|nr:hypothetical protein B0H11DRAFT_732280 [Mycena galericulata]
MSAAYTPLPTQADPNGYPPPRSKALLSRLTPTAPPTRIRRLLLFLAVLALSSTLLVYLVFLPSSNGWIIPQNLLNGQGYGYTEPGDTSSPFFRDPHPALHTRLFLARAQAEIRSRRLDTCNGKLSTPMVDGYMNAAVEYCTPHDTSPAAASITCFPARGSSSPNSWWPYPQSFCASRNLAHTHGWGGDLKQRGRFTAPCSITSAGAKLNDDMGREMFLGKEFDAADAAPDQACRETIAHPVLFVPRQDRWNPFHVGEDLVTTFLALTLFSRHSASSSSLFSGASKLWTSLPDAYAKYASSSSSNGDAAAAESDFAALRGQLAHELQGTEGLQLIFQDDYRPTESLFAPLYDRMGAFSPRRTGAEALGEGGPTCFTTAFHSVGAGASLLSGTGVGKEFTCASELVWGASLWLRWIWGLEELPGGYGGEEDEGGLFRRAGRFSRRAGEDEALARRAPVAAQSGHRDPLQVLFLSREKFDSYTRHQHNGGLTPWQEARHIVNEHELVAGLRTGLASLCRTVTHVGVAREGELLLHFFFWLDVRRGLYVSLVCTFAARPVHCSPSSSVLYDLRPC